VRVCNKEITKRGEVRLVWLKRGRIWKEDNSKKKVEEKRIINI